MTTPYQRLNDYSYLNVVGDATIFWEKRIEYSGSNPIYIGYNRKANAPTSEDSWYIVKVTYSGSDPTYYQLPVDGPVFKYAWDDRATYF